MAISRLIRKLEIERDWRVGDKVQHMIGANPGWTFVIQKIEKGLIYPPDEYPPYYPDQLMLDPSVYDDAKAEYAIWVAGKSMISDLDSGPGLAARTDLKKPPHPERRRRTKSWAPYGEYDLLTKDAD